MRSLILMLLLTACAIGEDRLVWVPGHFAQDAHGERVWIEGQYVRQPVEVAAAVKPEWVEARWVWDEKLQVWVMRPAHWEAPVTQPVAVITPVEPPPPRPPRQRLLGVEYVVGSGYSYGGYDRGYHGGYDYSGHGYYDRHYGYGNGNDCGRGSRTTVVNVTVPPPTPANLKRLFNGKSPR